MAQNITLWGASYSDVPSVTLPKTGGGTASFTDVSDTTAAAADVASGKYFYTAAGVKTQGTASGGGGSATIEPLTVTANGTYTAPTGVDGYSPVNVSLYQTGTTGTYTATIVGNGVKEIVSPYNSLMVMNGAYGSTAYYTDGDTFTFNEGDECTPYIYFSSAHSYTLTYDGVTLYSGSQNGMTSLCLPACDVTISMGYTSSTAYITVTSAVTPKATYITGTFTMADSLSYHLPYRGNGYPIAAMVFPDGGAYNSAVSPWYSSTQRYAVGQWTFSKSVMTSTPTYGTTGNQNQGVTTWVYKNSTSQSTTYSRSSAMNTNVLSSAAAASGGATCVRFNSNKILSTFRGTYTSSSSYNYGLLEGVKYRFIIIYSS